MTRSTSPGDEGPMDDDQGRMAPNPPGRMGSDATGEAADAGESRPAEGGGGATGDGDDITGTKPDDLGKGYGRSEVPA